MLVKSMTLRRNRVRPCSTVWDLRQPDGTAYPEHQLAAAAAAFDAAARVRSPGLRRLTTFDASDMHDTAQRETWATNSAPQSTRSGEESQFHVKVGEGSTGADGVHYHGERDDTMAKYELEAVRQANDGPCNIQRGLHRESTIGRDNEDTLDEVGVVARSWSLRAEGWKGSTAKALVASAIGTLAALVFLVMLGLFGWGQRESSANEVMISDIDKLDFMPYFWLLNRTVAMMPPSRLFWPFCRLTCWFITGNAQETRIIGIFASPLFCHHTLLGRPCGAHVNQINGAWYFLLSTVYRAIRCLFPRVLKRFLAHTCCASKHSRVPCRHRCTYLGGVKKLPQKRVQKILCMQLKQ